MVASEAGRMRRPENAPVLVKWAGGKSSLAKTLMSLISKRQPRRLIEPFAGSAALFFHLECKAVLGDTNRHLISLYQAVKQEPSKVLAELEAIRNEAAHLSELEFHDYYYRIRESFPVEDMFINAARMLFLNRHCWNGLYRENRLGKFNTPIGSHNTLQQMPTFEQLGRASRLLQRAELVFGDFMITVRAAKKGDIVYFDPPYMPLSNTARFAHYQSSSFSWRDHVRLKHCLYDLRDRGIDFVLSNSYQDLTTNFYQDFHQQVVEVTAPISSRGEGRQPRKELIVTSFAAKGSERGKRAS